MYQKVVKAGKTIQGHLVESERAIDSSIIEHAGLLSSLLAARMELGFAACAHAELIQEAGRMVADGLAHRDRAIGVHEKLAGIADRFGINPRAFGDSGDKSAVGPLLPIGLAVVEGGERQAA